MVSGRWSVEVTQRERAARLRVGLRSKPVSVAATPDPRVHVSTGHLRSLANHARSLSFLPRQPARSVLNGRHASKLRGRGLSFEELRSYLPGDDVRTIDWKVTARTRTPHVRVYSEERDRPALIVCDQRMSMFFGSVLNMKSVTAAEVASIAAFRILDQGDRIGGIVFTDDSMAEIKPRRSAKTLDRLLHAISAANCALNAEARQQESMALNDVLISVGRIAKRGHLILIVSDFDGINERTQTLLAGLAQRNDLLIGLVTDPLAHELPPNLKIVASDGELQAEIDTGDRGVRQALSDFSKGRLATILSWQRKLGIPVLPFTTADATAPQLRRLLGRIA